MEESVSKRLAKSLADRWIFRLPEEERYKYASGHWSTHDGTSYEITNEIENELMKLRERYPASHKKRMGTLQFRKLMEEYLKQRLYKMPKPLKGVHFTNGLLVVQDDKRELISPGPNLWSFNQCGIALDQCTRLTEAHKSFLLSLTDGNQLKLNIIRAYL